MEEDTTKKSRAWAFTWFDISDTNTDLMNKWECQFLSVNLETCPTTGKKHYQGHILFKNQCRLSAMKKCFPKDIHWGACYSEELSANYTMKEGSLIFRDIRAQGSRTDLKKVALAIKDEGLKASIDQFPESFIKFHRGMRELDEHYNPQDKRRFKPHVTWIYGPTGTGKTRFVQERETNLWESSETGQYWFGYENQEATIFDDFRADFCKFHVLLKYLDRYPMTVKTFYGWKHLNSKRMYITSCYPPDKVYETREDIGQLLRRIDTIIYMPCLGVSEVERGVILTPSQQDNLKNSE